MKLTNQTQQKPTAFFIRVKSNPSLVLSGNAEDLQAVHDMKRKMKDRIAGQSFATYEDLVKELDAITPEHKYDLTAVCDNHKFREPPYMESIGFACFAVVNTHPEILFLQSNDYGFTCYDFSTVCLDHKAEAEYHLNVKETLSLWLKGSDHYDEQYVLQMFDMFCKSRIDLNAGYSKVVVQKSIHMDKVIGEGVHSELVNDSQSFYESHLELDFSSNTSIADAAIRLLDAGYKLYDEYENRLYHCSFHPGVLRYERKPRHQFSSSTETEIASFSDVLNFYHCA